MKLIIGIGLFLGLGIAHADVYRPAILDLTCKSETSSKVIEITSSSTGTIVKVNGQQVVKSDYQLNGAIEGGPPYLKVVGGGYSISLSGGSFASAFYNRSEVADGVVKTYVNAYDANEIFWTVCRGLISFK